MDTETIRDGMRFAGVPVGSVCHWDDRRARCGLGSLRSHFACSRPDLKSSGRLTISRIVGPVARGQEDVRVMLAQLPPEDATLGVYHLLGRIGQGGMGTVYLGRSPQGRLVAIKVVRADLRYDDEFRRRFRSEVNRARQVPPFCTAEVLDADPDHDPPYLVVEYVDGKTLAEVVNDQGPLSGSALHSVAVGTATALAAIHGARVIHRDFKPANVLLAVGGVKVIDFGIARPLEITSAHTRTD